MPAVSQAFRCFDEVARHGSIRKAAALMHLTAPAVNQQILNLEATVGTPLFDRLPRGMQLTSAGEIMLAAVRRGQRDYDNALAQVEDLRALRRGHITIGVSHSSAENLIPEVMQGVMRRYPGLAFTVRSGNGESLLRWLATGEIDTAYCLRRTPPPRVAEVRSWPQQLGVVGSPEHPLFATDKALRLRDCLDYPLILMAPDMELRAMAERIEPRLQHLGRPLVETSSVPMVRKLLQTGHALSFLIPENVAPDVKAGKLVWKPLQDALAHSHTCLYQRLGYTAAIAMGMFLGELDNVLASIRDDFAGVQAA